MHLLQKLKLAKYNAYVPEGSKKPKEEEKACRVVRINVNWLMYVQKCIEIRVYKQICNKLTSSFGITFSQTPNWPCKSNIIPILN